jgi:hypothetical protein
MKVSNQRPIKGNGKAGAGNTFPDPRNKPSRSSQTL